MRLVNLNKLSVSLHWKSFMTKLLWLKVNFDKSNWNCKLFILNNTKNLKIVMPFSNLFWSNGFWIMAKQWSKQWQQRIRFISNCCLVWDWKWIRISIFMKSKKMNGKKKRKNISKWLKIWKGIMMNLRKPSWQRKGKEIKYFHNKFQY